MHWDSKQPLRYKGKIPVGTKLFSKHCYVIYIHGFVLQESVCLDNGSYLMNYAGCKNCGDRESVRIVNRQETKDAEEEHEELVTFQRNNS